MARDKLALMQAIDQLVAASGDRLSRWCAGLSEAMLCAI